MRQSRYAFRAVERVKRAPGESRELNKAQGWSEAVTVSAGVKSHC